MDIHAVVATAKAVKVVVAQGFFQETQILH